MRYLTLVADYDGTLADSGRISEETAAALERLRASGRRAIMVTGRRLNDLLAVCTCPKLFDIIVAENGAVVYEPGTRNESVLANPPSKALLKASSARSVTPLEIGQVIPAKVAQLKASDSAGSRCGDFQMSSDQLGMVGKGGDPNGIAANRDQDSVRVPATSGARGGRRLIDGSLGGRDHSFARDANSYSSRPSVR